MPTNTAIRCLAASLTAALLLSSAPAEAGRRPFIWVWDTEVLHEREMEIEQWIWEMKKPNGMEVAWLWWAPIVGITDQLELAIPIEAAWWWSPNAATGVWQTDTRLETWGLSLRYRLAENDRDEAGPVVPLVRFGVKRLLPNGKLPNGERDSWQLEGNAVVSFDDGPLHTTVNIGGFYRPTSGAAWLTYSWGIAWAATDNLRLGGEVFGEWILSGARKDVTMVGPDVGWTHGRGWFTVGCLIGVSEFAATYMPRLIWAIKF